MNKLELAKWLHNNYEEIAREKKWETQKSFKVEFDDLPKENKDTMISLADRIINNFLKNETYECEPVRQHDGKREFCQFTIDTAIYCSRNKNCYYCDFKPRVKAK